MNVNEQMRANASTCKQINERKLKQMHQNPSKKDMEKTKNKIGKNTEYHHMQPNDFQLLRDEPPRRMMTGCRSKNTNEK